MFVSPMKKIFIWILLASIFSSPAWAGRKLTEMPEPRLLAPGDIVELNGSKEMEFRWGNESGDFDHYDFRVFKGPQPYEPYQLIQKNIPKGTTSVLIDASQFTPGETYSWSLRYRGSKKSMPAYSIFKIKA